MRQPGAQNPLREVADEPPLPGRTVEIAPGILWLRMPLPFALNHVNLWLIAEDDGYTLVDCGYGDATTRAHWREHFATTLDQRPIRRIIATHCHPDHLGNAAWLAAHFGCPIAMTQGEFLAAHAMIGQQAGFGQTELRALFARHGMAAEHLASLAARGNHYHRGVPEAPHAFIRLIDGDTLPMGRWSWRIIGGYGHSPEHAALATSEGRLLVAGDMLLPRISTNVAVWPGAGGQQQRVAIARALVYEPPVILLDEPLSNLDAKLREEARAWLRTLIVTLGLSAIHVTHDQVEAMAIADRVVLLDAGVIAQEGSPTTLYNEPTTLFAAEFMGSNNRIDGKLVENSGDRATIELFGERLSGIARTKTAIGEKATGIVRIERVRCASSPGPNRLKMELKAPMYLGERWELVLARESVTVRAYASAPLEPGEHYVEFPPEALWVF